MKGRPDGRCGKETVKDMQLTYTWPLFGIKYRLSRGEGGRKSFSTLISTSICRRPVQDKTSESIHQRGGLVCPWGLHKQRRSVSEELLDIADHPGGSKFFRHPEAFAVTQRCIRTVQAFKCPAGRLQICRRQRADRECGVSSLYPQGGELHGGPESETASRRVCRKVLTKAGACFDMELSAQEAVVL